MLPVLLAIAAAGSVVSAVASIEESESRADQARRDAALKNLQADETLARADINAKLMRRQGDRMISGQVAQYGAFNTELGDSQFGLLRDTDRSVSEQIDLMKREAEFRAAMLRQGANSSEIQANDIQSAGYWNAAGSLLSGGASAAKSYGAFDSNPSTPKVG